MKFNIPIILGSTRRERQSIKVAKFVLKRVQQSPLVSSELLDLAQYEFPIMEERLRFRDDPPRGLREFARKVDEADSIIIVSPEYNHGYPGVLKNALDYLLPEYERKPVGIVTVSAGRFGGLNCLNQLRIVSLGMGAFPIPAEFAVAKVQESFDDQGETKNPAYEGVFREFFEELLWFTEAVVVRKQKDRARAA